MAYNERATSAQRAQAIKGGHKLTASEAINFVSGNLIAKLVLPNVGLPVRQAGWLTIAHAASFDSGRTSCPSHASRHTSKRSRPPLSSCQYSFLPPIDRSALIAASASRTCANSSKSVAKKSSVVSGVRTTFLHRLCVLRARRTTTESRSLGIGSCWGILLCSCSRVRCGRCCLV